MVSKVAQIREELSFARDLAKGQILFVAVQVLDEEHHKKLKMLQASIVLQIAREVGVPVEFMQEASKP